MAYRKTAVLKLPGSPGSEKAGSDSSLAAGTGAGRSCQGFEDVDFDSSDSGESGFGSPG